MKLLVSLFIVLTASTSITFAETKICRENGMGDSLYGIFKLEIIDFDITDIKYKDISEDEIDASDSVQNEDGFNLVEWSADPENINARSSYEYFIKFNNSSLGEIETKMSLGPMNRQIKFSIGNKLYVLYCKDIEL